MRKFLYNLVAINFLSFYWSENIFILLSFFEEFVAGYKFTLVRNYSIISYFSFSSDEKLVIIVNVVSVNRMSLFI